MFAKLVCPNCQTLGQFSVDGGNYKGPYRCWKCRKLYTIDIENGKAISWQPLGEQELKELKVKEETQQGVSPGDLNTEQTPQRKPAHRGTNFVWPEASSKIIQESLRTEPTINPTTWPKDKATEPELAPPPAPPPPKSQASPLIEGEKATRSKNGVVLFENIALLADAEKLLTNEGCTIVRVSAPTELRSGSVVALRFPWSQYETVKSLIDKARIQTKGIRQL